MKRQAYCHACYLENHGVKTRIEIAHTCGKKDSKACEKRLRVYIAGKVTGEQIAQLTMKFGDAQMYLEAKGYEAVNPLAVVNDWHCSWQDAMRKCIAALVTCDAIHMLPDSKQSKGARMEYDIANALGMPLIK